MRQVSGGAPGTYAALCRRFAAAAGLAAAALGALVLAGWAFDLAALTGPIPGAATMKANTALGLVLLGAALALRSGVTARADAWSAPARASAAAAALLGLLALLEYALAIDLGIDELLVRDPGSPIATTHPGRMSPQAALCSVLLGAAVFRLDEPPARGWVAQGLALAAGAVAFVSLLGYLYGAPGLYDLGAAAIGIAVHTAAALALLAAGVLGARPETGVMALVASPTAGGFTARRLLPLTFALPLSAGMLRLAGERAGLYGPEFGLALMTLGAITVPLAFSLWIARSLDDAEARRRESERRYRELFERVPVGLYRTNLGGRLVEANPALLEIFGFADRERLLATGVTSLYGDPIERDRLRARLEHNSTVVESAIPAVRSDGSPIWVDVDATVVRDARGQTIAYEGAVRDVTAQRRADLELHAALDQAREADRLKSVFLANMNHEIRTPLNIILGFTDVLREELGPQAREDQRHVFAAIDEASHRLLKTMHSVLDYARLESGGFELRPRLVDVAALVERQVQEHARAAAAKGLRLTSEIRAPRARAPCDEYSLTRSVACLLDNAIKFTRRGSVVVRLLRDADDRLALEVEDTGVGIDPAYLSRLFAPFSQQDDGQTRAFEGSGLGLALARRLLELNGATITARSEQERGSTFTIRFAAEAERAQPAALPSPRAVVLVVEDDAASRSYLEGLLRPRYRVCLAGDAAEARAALEAHGGEIGVILIDLSLGAGEDGLSLARSLTHAGGRWRDLPVIAVTAHVSGETLERCYAAGCTGYLAKPVPPALLFETIAGALGGSAGGAKPRRDSRDS